MGEVVMIEPKVILRAVIFLRVSGREQRASVREYESVKVQVQLLMSALSVESKAVA